MRVFCRIACAALLGAALSLPAGAQDGGSLPSGMASDLEQKAAGNKSAGEIREALTRGLAIQPSKGETAEESSAAEAETAAAPASRPSVALRITFDFDSDRLTAQARSQLDELAAALNDPSLSGSRFRLEGHTDAKGSAAYNQDLSERRARSAARYLRERHGIPAGRIETRGMGERQPIPGTDPGDGANRRVVVTNLGA